jgi:CheY-like chemotaxis protein
LNALLPHADLVPDEKKGNGLLSEEFAKQFPLSILVAEDNPINQKLIEHTLTRLGFAAVLKENGKEVVAELGTKEYDIVFMDVQMPEMDGLEATRAIRASNKKQPVIIALTANVMQGDQEECLRAGMNDYLSKPLKLEELIMMLEKWYVQKENMEKDNPLGIAI